jgi:hypothetical protein
VVAIAPAAAPALTFPDPAEGFGYNAQSMVRATQASKGPFATPDQWPTYLGLMTHDGIHIARADGLWAPAEPKAPSGGTHTYDWSTADGIAGGFARQGVRWDVVLTGSPRWASGSTSTYNSPRPEFYGDYAIFAGAFAARYGANGSFWAEHPEIPKIPVQQFEIWNEPNTAVHWGTTPDPTAYARLFAGAQAAIKAADPGAKVSVGGVVWNNDVAFINGFFGALGSGAAVDGLGSHPYAPTAFSLAANVVRVRKALDDLGRQDVPLEINELGWPAAYDGRAPAARAVQGPVSDAARAATMALSIDSLARSTCAVGDLMVYSLVEAEDDPAHIETLMGDYRRNGTTTLTSAAFADSLARYRADKQVQSLPVPVCGAHGATATRVLPLTVDATPAANGCANARVTYRGNPLEEAQVRLLSPGFGTQASDSDGRALVCPSGPLAGRQPLRLSADIAGVAASNVQECTTSGCRSIGPAAICATKNLKLVGRLRIRTILQRGLRVRTSGCDPQIGSPVRLRASLVITRAAARKAGIAARTKLVTIARASIRIDPGAKVQVAAKLTKAAKRALRKARRVAATLQVTAVEDRTADAVTRKVTLKR